MSVDLLLEDAEVVAHHHDLVEENIEGNFFGLERWISGMQDHFALMPADTELVDERVGFLEAKGLDDGLDGVLDEGLEGRLEAGDGDLRFGWLEAAGRRLDSALGIFEANFGGVLADRFHRAHAILWMANFHPHVQRIDFHHSTLPRALPCPQRNFVAVLALALGQRTG